MKYFRKTNTKPVVQFDMEMKVIKEWESVGFAAATLGIKSDYINRVCNGRRKTFANCIWRWKEDNIEGEIWKEHSCGNIVSNKGRVQMKNGSKSYGIERIDGYLKIRTKDNRYRMVHRLILEAFVGMEEGKTCDHIDRNKGNNKLENLRWATNSQQVNNRTPHAEFKHCQSCTCKIVIKE